MTGAIARLPILIVNVHSRCNCRCVMCDIWKTDTPQEISLDQFRAQLDSVEPLGVEWIVFSGGEPLMHSNLFALCGLAKSRGLRVTVLSTGLLLERYASAIPAHIDDLIVSLDGPQEIHDQIRRTHSAFDRLAAGVRALNIPVAARCTIQQQNYHAISETIAAAKDIGMTSISFLAADVTSEAFNRASLWPIERQNQVALAASETETLERTFEGIIARKDPFVIDTADKLRRIVRHFRAHLGLAKPEAPQCNAPWVSAVLEANGAVRPCFFHKPIGTIDTAPIADLLNSPKAKAFRESLDISTNPTCQNCVCSLKRV